MIGYDLQLYLRSRLPTLASCLSTKSKLNYLSRTWRSSVGGSNEFEYLRISVPISLEMACILVSFGSSFEFDNFAQLELATTVDREDGDTIFKCFKEMSNNVTFLINEEGYFQENLHSAL